MHRSRLPLFFSAAFAGLLVLAGAQAQETAAPAESAAAVVEATVLCDADPPIRVEPPRVVLDGLAAKVTVRPAGELPRGMLRVEIRGPAGSVLGAGEMTAAEPVTIEVRVPRGRHDLEARLPDHYTGGAIFFVRSVPGWLSVLPPAFAILFALVFRQVIPALVAGVWLGAWIGYGGPFTGLLRTLDHYVIEALRDPGHLSIVIFSMFLGGMVGVMSRSGGTAGLVDALRPYATDSRRGQVVTWLLGVLVFFDDYANTLVVGNTMRPVTDRLRISREKLAYIVDSTAAPVAAVFLISTWIGYEVSLIGEALEQLDSDANAYTIFLRAIPYNFYPLLALVFGFMVAFSGRDFGSMHRAEQRAAGGRLLGDRAVPLSDFDHASLSPTDDKPRRWINAAIPVLVVVNVTFATLWFGGRQALVEAGRPEGTAGFFELGLSGIGTVLGEGDPYGSLLYAAFGGCLAAIVLAVGQRILTLGQSLEAMLGGFKSMVMAFVILTLAWAISEVCKELQTSDFMVSTLSDKLSPALLPTLVFLLSAATAFATGSSWSTMGILIPLAVPTAYGVARAAGYAGGAAEGILLGSVASVLAGAIFGDHCSPISDTTVLSSMSSGCDHVDHVRTQLPYALVVGVVGTLLGVLPAGFGVPPWVGLSVSAAALALILWFFGRRSG